MSHKLQIRTVTVELLRAGPAHNQLISPLTQSLISRMNVCVVYTGITVNTFSSNRFVIYYFDRLDEIIGAKNAIHGS